MLFTGNGIPVGNKINWDQWDFKIFAFFKENKSKICSVFKAQFEWKWKNGISNHPSEPS